MQITATQGGSTANGMLLRVYVLTGALPAASQTGNSSSVSFSGQTVFSASITNSTGSNIYLASEYGSNVATATGGNMTLVDTVADGTNLQTYVTGHATGLASGTTNRGFSLSGSESGPFAMLEILASGTIAEDGSSPASVTTTGAGPVTTASFNPPAGSLLVALVTSKGGAGVTTFTVSGGGLSWTQKVVTDPSGGNYAGIWIADNTTPNGSVQPRPTVTPARRYPARAVTGKIFGTPPPLPAKWGGYIVRRFPATAVYGGYASTIVGTPGINGGPGGAYIIRRVPASAFWGGYAVQPVVIPPPPPVSIPPAIPTSGGDIGYTIRVFREIKPGDVPTSGSALPKIHGRAYLLPVPIEPDQAQELDTPPPITGHETGIIDAIGQALAAASATTGKVVEYGRIFADPPYEKHRKTCGAIRKIGGVMLTCTRKPGHNGKHTDRGLDWG